MLPSTPQLLILVFVLTVTLVLPYAVFSPIARKAGFSKWWSLTMVIPLVNILVIWAFAFARWPVESSGRPNTN